MEEIPDWAIIRPVKQRYPYSSAEESAALRAQYPGYARWDDS